MKISELLREDIKPQSTQQSIQQNKPNVAKDVNKPLALKVWADRTFPVAEMAKLGRININNPEDTKKVRELVERLLRANMNNTDYINLTAQPDNHIYINWLLDRYSRGMINFEDASGEGLDSIAKWVALRNQPPRIGRKNNRFPTDINSFRDIKQLQTLVQDDWYSNVLNKLRNQEEVEKHKRTQKEFVLIDNDRYRVSIPFNMGACYVFNNTGDVQANFCTGSSSGNYWFGNYAKQGPIIMVSDKLNQTSKEGKWQIHAPTHQIVNAEQDNRYYHNENATEFGKLFPGLMKEIVEKLRENNDVLKKLSVENIENVNDNGYDIEEDIKMMKDVFPGAFTDKELPQN